MSPSFALSTAVWIAAKVKSVGVIVFPASTSSLDTDKLESDSLKTPFSFADNKFFLFLSTATNLTSFSFNSSTALTSFAMASASASLDKATVPLLSSKSTAETADTDINTDMKNNKINIFLFIFYPHIIYIHYTIQKKIKYLWV